MAAVLLGVFAVIELSVARTPLVPFRLFRSRSVTGANIVMFLVGAAFFSMWYFLSLYLQNVLGYGALRGGAGLPPHGDHHHHRGPGQLAAPAQVGVRPLLLAGTVLADGGFAWLSRIGAAQQLLGTTCSGPAA